MCYRAVKDGQLDREEFGAFLHPHTAEWMQRCLAIEALEAMDTNDNGLVDEDEFLKVSCILLSLKQDQLSM